MLQYARARERVSANGRKIIPFANTNAALSCPCSLSFAFHPSSAWGRRSFFSRQLFVEKWEKNGLGDDAQLSRAVFLQKKRRVSTPFLFSLLFSFLRANEWRREREKEASQKHPSKTLRDENCLFDWYKKERKSDLECVFGPFCQRIPVLWRRSLSSRCHRGRGDPTGDPRLAPEIETRFKLSTVFMKWSSFSMILPIPWRWLSPFLVSLSPCLFWCESVPLKTEMIFPRLFFYF